jgi:hypothetical protein
LIQEREERFKVVDDIRVNLPNVPAEEVEKDVQSAVEASRKRRA